MRGKEGRPGTHESAASALDVLENHENLACYGRAA
jgi:hypothetical protein